MIADLQGSLYPDGKFWLSDPAIHSTDMLRFGCMNHGVEGYSLFFESHSCNSLCKGLGLKAYNHEGYSSESPGGARRRYYGKKAGSVSSSGSCASSML